MERVDQLEEMMKAIELREMQFVMRVIAWANLNLSKQQGEVIDETGSKRYSVQFNTDIYVKVENDKFVADIVDRTPGPDEGQVTRVTEDDERLPPMEAFASAEAFLAQQLEEGDDEEPEAS